MGGRKSIWILRHSSMHSLVIRMRAFRDSARVPSVPVPERMIPIAISPLSSARDRKKESIGSLTPRTLLRGLKAEFPIGDGHLFVRRDHVDTIGLHSRSVNGLVHLKLCYPSQKLGHHAGVTRVEMGNQNKSHTDIHGHAGEELLRSLKPACRSSYTDNGDSSS
jgi:hypothetical protein